MDAAHQSGVGSRGRTTWRSIEGRSADYADGKASSSS
jgi:hypothetical protein